MKIKVAGCEDNLWKDISDKRLVSEIHICQLYLSKGL